MDRGAGLPGLVVALILISLALGGVKASLPPLLGMLGASWNHIISSVEIADVIYEIAEQCSKIKPRIKISKSGERVILDPDATVQYAFHIYYW